ncbi:unnamed protein product [Tuber aestivum]|uniref:Uncharacterized protein n=1 Tax=Tuber aestivum TaxID=59557 RepID=A0A292PXB9_9PEZI|nr:unnamed protein product [Tuber aestivum]
MMDHRLQSVPSYPKNCSTRSPRPYWSGRPCHQRSRIRSRGSNNGSVAADPARSCYRGVRYRWSPAADTGAKRPHFPPR